MWLPPGTRFRGDAGEEAGHSAPGGREAFADDRDRSELSPSDDEEVGPTREGREGGREGCSRKRGQKEPSKGPGRAALHPEGSCAGFLAEAVHVYAVLSPGGRGRGPVGSSPVPGTGLSLPLVRARVRSLMRVCIPQLF